MKVNRGKSKMMGLGGEEGLVGVAWTGCDWIMYEI